jgi:hypothetical protein
MKIRYKLLIGSLLVIFSLAFAEYYYTVVVRTFLDVRGKAVITDSLRVQGTTKFVGAVTMPAAQSLTGKSSLDSLVVAGESRFGGFGDYYAMVSVKNDAVNTDIQHWWNSRAQSMAKIDSVGRGYFIGATITGSITATAQTLAIGAITSSGKSQIDSMSVVGKIYALGLPSDSAGIPRGTLFFLAADGIVRWKY